MKLVGILDNIRSVHNVGSIFRTADGAGVGKLYCCGVTPGPLDRFGQVRADFAKVALGAEKSVEWESAKDTQSTIAQLKRDGWKIVAVEQTPNSMPYYDFAAKRDVANEKIALIVGNEVDGLSPDILSAADIILEISMRGKKESLNVAVAFGIVAFAIAAPTPGNDR